MLEDALKNAFGINCRLEQIKMSGLPLYMTSERAFYNAVMGEVSFMIVTISDKEKFGAVALKKQLVQYIEKSSLNVAYYFDSLTRVQRDALISKEIPFVSLPDQIYMPFLGVMLSNSFKKKMTVATDKMMPATQCLFLYLLYHSDNDSFIKMWAAEDLGLTKTSITRASEQLKRMGLIREERSGKEIRMIPLFKGYELFETAKDHLINPIQKVLHAEITTDKEFFIAGETMLSRYSMLAAPGENTYAIYKGSEIVSVLKDMDTRWQDNTKASRIELWKYDPGLFALNGEVDPVSLAMSLSDNADERVEGELQSFLEEYRW
ncbi:MAG: MarR family transcriptional regulator [Oscillospiraceae bacterium]|nr:MarR family transcriptional regulator [Oscillospiraceae bacterium]